MDKIKYGEFDKIPDFNDNFENYCIESNNNYLLPASKSESWDTFLQTINTLNQNENWIFRGKMMAHGI